MIDESAELEQDLTTAEQRANDASINRSLDQGSEIIQNRGKQIAQAKMLYRTGKGVAGINYQETGPFARGIGWSARPNFHLYFHEIGTYKDLPRPHLRPAADEKSREVQTLLEQDIVGND